MPQGIQEQVLPVAPIEPELHFGKVGRKMLRANLVPRTDDAALQEREGVFYGIGMYLPVNINLATVIDRFVPIRKLSHCLGVGAEIIRNNDLNILADIVLDVLTKSAGFDILRLEKPDGTATLSQADNNLLVGKMMALRAFF